jgi:hydroxymethylbilane synthase
MLEADGYSASLLGMTTQGDQLLESSLSKVGGKGLFLKELEHALEEGEADVAVHSLKDVPMSLPAGFQLACILKREDPRDAFVSNKYNDIWELPYGAVIGTSSIRRAMLLKDLRADLQIEPLRGNLNTRLKKLDNQAYDAIVLAAAGLNRLNMQQRVKSYFHVNQMLPAPGQGALAIEIKSDRLDMYSVLQPFKDSKTLLTTTAERALSKTMDGSCSVPLAAHATYDGEKLHIYGAWGVMNGEGYRVFKADAVGAIEIDDIASAEALGVAVANELHLQSAL